MPMTKEPMTKDSCENNLTLCEDGCVRAVVLAASAKRQIKKRYGTLRPLMNERLRDSGPQAKRKAAVRRECRAVRCAEA